MTSLRHRRPIPVLQVFDYRSKPRPMRKVWNDSFRSMLTPLDGEAQLEQDGG